MRRWKPLALLLSLVLLTAPPLGAQASDAKVDLGANAALKYWQAFAQMPAADKEQESLLAEWNKVPFHAAAIKLISASEKSRLYLQRGAKLPRCDWSLDYEDGMNLLLPYLAKSRDLARLAALHARYEFEQGHWEAGIEDATAILALARHVGSEPIMICILVRYAIERIAIDLVTPYLPQLQAFSPRILKAYETLPVGATVQQAFLAEKKYFLEWLLHRLKEAEAKQKGAWREILKGAIGVEGELDGAAVVQQVGTYERAIQLVEEILSLSDQMTELVKLPRHEFERQYPEFKKKAKSANLLAGPLLTAADKMLASEQRNQALMALLSAALVVIQDGPDKLKDIKDPFGDGPFEYRALDKGFELKSKLHYNDQPVVLRVGQEKKE